ncbi:MAG TPA: sulfatase [Thermoanaerobaculia bacterium]|nr:sulfatase [Thermoanaerobaculia bacterium]
MRTAGAALALLAAACSPSPPTSRAPEVLLIDGTAAPDVLVEARTLAPPPATAGNRFLTGWTIEREGDVRLLRADPRGARLEGVHLGTEPRRLVLVLVPPVPAGAMEVSVAGRAPSRIPFAERVEVSLPTDLPRGRFVVDLRFPDGTAPLLRGAGFDRAQAAGEVAVGKDELRQGGVSRVELVRPLAGTATLVGEMVPPVDGRAGQRFEIHTRGRSGERVLWTWQSRWWHRGAQRLRVPVRGEDGWLRLAVVASTPGPAASWRGLALAEGGGVGDAAPRPAGDEGGTSSARGEGDTSATPPATTASPKQASPPPPRLVLLYVFDALRADAVGSRDPRGAGTTPTLDRLGSEGARFAAHFSVAPNTLPSTKALLTGHVWRQRGGVPLGPTPVTLAERFRAAGWRTGLFSGNVHVSRAFGVDRGFEAAPESTLFGADTERTRPFNDNAATVHRAALEWVRSLPPGARAFLYLHVIHPHNPYDPPPALRARFDDSDGATLDGSSPTLLGIEQRRFVPTDADRRRIRALYHAGLAYADGELASLLAALRERYAPEETLLAVTADHGEELFERGGVLHGYTLYDEMLHIPLLVWSPGRVPARTVTRPTDSLDLHRALAALAGSEGNGAPSLWAMLREPGAGAGPREPARELRFAAASALRGGIFSARTARWKVVWAPRTGAQWGMGQGAGRSREPEYVFDLVADPQERHNLGGIDEPEVQWLRARLLAWAASAEADDGGTTAPQDAETRARLRALGYVD